MVLGASVEAAETRAKPPTDLCIGSQCGFAVEPTAVQSRSAATFVDSIGVNVHFNQLQTPYVTLFPLVKEKLLELGISHVRDGAADRFGGFPERDQSALFRELGAAGIRVAFIFNPNVTREFVQGFPARVAPAFEAYEFPNEFNAAKPDWVATLRAWAPVFQSYVRSNEATADYPIIGPSLTDKGDDPHAALGDLSAYMDFGNTHAYYSSRHPATTGWGGKGAPPCDAWRYGAIEHKLCNTRRVSGTKPIMSTETGWGTDTAAKNQIPQSLQAKYLVRMLLLHFEAGISRTYIYQLIDSGTDGFTAYGLLTAAGREKPAFGQIKSLIGLMRDAAPVAAPETLSFSLSGDAADVRSMVFQKSDSSFRLVLWIEKPGFDPLTALPLAVSSRSTDLRLAAPARATSISAFQDDGSVRDAAPSRGSSGEYALTLTDNLTVVAISR